jgi:hypothetical protein
MDIFQLMTRFLVSLQDRADEIKANNKQLSAILICQQYFA